MKQKKLSNKIRKEGIGVCSTTNTTPGMAKALTFEEVSFSQRYIVTNSRYGMTKG